MLRVKLVKIVILLAVGLVAVISTQSRSTGQTERIKDLEEKVSRQPNNVELQSQLGIAYFYKARLGDMAAADKAIALLDRRVKADPSDTSAARWLGLTYYTKVSLIGQSRGKPEDCIAVLQDTLAAFDKVLVKSPNDAIALSAHGSALTTLSGYKRDGSLFPKGIDEMNRAVSGNPSDYNPELLRALALINLPPPFGNLNIAATDINNILKEVPPGLNDRAKAVLQVYLGDIYVETKQPALAKAQYEAATKMAQPASEVAQSRLAALEQNQVKLNDIRHYREAAINCTLCHSH